MKVKIKKMSESAIIPTTGSKKASGYDLYSDEEADITPGTTVKVKTGIAIAIPDGYFGAIYARSGMATKRGLRPANCVGVCDPDYRGEYIVALYNDSSETQHIDKGDRIAQLVVMPFLSIEFEETDALDDTERGAGGFGSTGTK